MRGALLVFTLLRSDAESIDSISNRKLCSRAARVAKSTAARPNTTAGKSFAMLPAWRINPYPVGNNHIQFHATRLHTPAILKIRKKRPGSRRKQKKLGSQKRRSEWVSARIGMRIHSVAQVREFMRESLASNQCQRPSAIQCNIRGTR